VGGPLDDLNTARAATTRRQRVSCFDGHGVEKTLHGNDSRWILGAIDAELAKDSAESSFDYDRGSALGRTRGQSYCCHAGWKQ
jgi:hypothetical protein